MAASDPAPAARPVTPTPVTQAWAPAPGCDDDGEPVDPAALEEDPLCGPPEGEEAWLGQVASEVAGEYLDAQAAARPAAREVLAAGFTHREHGPGPQGFAGGGPADQLEPGPVLAWFTDDVVRGGLAKVTDDELVGVMCAARRIASWASGIELSAVAGLGTRRQAYAAASGDCRQAEHVGDEVAAAMTLTCRAADRLVSLAAGVARLPAVTAALAAGRIDMPRAIVFTSELPGLRDAAAALVAPDAGGLTTSRLREVLHRAVLCHDPDAARKRREKAQKSARVECWAEPAGTAAMAGRDLPPAQVLAADKHAAAARALKAAGAEGTLEQLRARVFLALLSGRPLYTLLPGQDQDDGQPGPGVSQPPGGDNANGAGRPGTDGQDADTPGGGDNDGGGHDGGGHADNDGPSDDSPSGDGGGTRRPGPGPLNGGPGAGVPRGGKGLPAGLTGTVNLTMPLATWLGLASQPGDAAGHGPIDTATCRDLAAAITATPGSRWCLTITGSGGRAIGHGCARTGPPGGSTGPPGRPGTAPPGTGPPVGILPPGSTVPPGDDRPWLADVKIKWLATGACGHARETLAYQPSRALRHLLKIRDRTCSYPGCRRPDVRCDDDHTIPHDQGGRTCERNLAALCRRHHAAKQAPGWHLQQAQPGTLTWTLPSGRAYGVTPRSYPM